MSRTPLCGRRVGEPAQSTLWWRMVRRIEELIAWGRNSIARAGKLAFAREGAHSRNRVLLRMGFQGKEIGANVVSEGIVIAVCGLRAIQRCDLLMADAPAAVRRSRWQDWRYAEIRAGAVLLATGGLGRVFRETTNPDVATATVERWRGAWAR